MRIPPVSRALAVLLVAVACGEAPIPTAPPTALRAARGVASLTAAEAGRYLVVASGPSLPRDLAGRVANLGGAVDMTLAPIGVAVVSGLYGDDAAQLQKTQGVAYVELDEELQWISNDVEFEIEDAAGSDATAVDTPASHLPPTSAGFYPRQWGMRAIGANLAWAAGRLGSPSVTVAILDSGIDYTHQSLNGLVDLALSRSFVASDQRLIDSVFAGQNLHPVVDLNRHGSHVASTVASTGHGTAGVTQKVRLVGVKVLAANGNGSSSGVLAGIVYAADIDADVINMSLGSTYSKSAFPGRVAGIQRAVNYAYRHGTVVVVSAGNEADDLDKLGDGFKSYCDAALVICVGSVVPNAPAASVNGPFAAADLRPGYSNFGAAVDVGAPGGTGNNRFIWAACSSYSLISTACRASKSFALGISGTSMAAPHVTGMAALIVENVGKNRPDLVRDMIRTYVDDIGKTGEDPEFGKGRINVAKAVGIQ